MLLTEIQPSSRSNMVFKCIPILAASFIQTALSINANSLVLPHINANDGDFLDEDSSTKTACEWDASCCMYKWNERSLTGSRNNWLKTLKEEKMTGCEIRAIAYDGGKGEILFNNQRIGVCGGMGSAVAIEGHSSR